MGYGEGQGVGLDLLTCRPRMRWIQRVEIIEENEPSPPAKEGRVSALEDLPAALPSGERAEATMMEMDSDSAGTETLSSEERSRGDGLSDMEQETSLAKEAIQVRREERAEAVLRSKEASEQQEGDRNDPRQSGKEAGEEVGMKKEPRLNSLSRWVCNTAGFEVRG